MIIFKDGYDCHINFKLNSLTCGPLSPGSPYWIDDLNTLVYFSKQKLTGSPRGPRSPLGPLSPVINDIH
jgi:hypothetical protein